MHLLPPNCLVPDGGVELKVRRAINDARDASLVDEVLPPLQRMERAHIDGLSVHDKLE